MQADETERAAAVGTFPGPTDHFVVAVDFDGEKRLNVVAAIEAIIMLVKGGEVGHAGENGMFGSDADVIALADDVFALRAAAGRAEEIKLAVDEFGVFGADAPMQRDDGAAA